MAAAEPKRAEYDVVVIGAGPTGATCARGLARAGASVLVIDRAAPPRYKTCGGGLTARARSLVELDVAVCVERECRAVDLHVAGVERRFRVEREEPLVSMTMRADLDRALAGAAALAGAEVVAPCAAHGLEARGGAWHIATPRGTLRARHVVAADGAASPTALDTGWRANPFCIPALESEIEVSDAAMERFGGSARFDLGIPPAGYGWVFPKRSHLSVGCLSVRRGARGLRRDLERYLDALGLEPLARADHGALIPIAPRSRVLARDGVFLAGDAAGLADPVTGEGIANGLASARLAVRAIVSCGGRAAVACEAYQDAVERELLAELRFAARLARLLYRPGRLRRVVLGNLGPWLCEAVADVVSGRTRYRRLAFRPPRPARRHPGRTGVGREPALASGPARAVDADADRPLRLR